ncbi:neuraminidase-like domain-containing protein [Photorhabdus bodei]|uniref:Toxin n=1 Tax=Photorhabdus bodei TaxID=2029681 RepID=A0ABX0ATH6_9GAMM|nr:neuraminidase-like domain-containing protein [Photorhabdus bodei]NDK99948.1 toxin [Photorhabdus bodei]NDL04142.1 toxin [Photorhabdus bodei]NDL08192.1 toxin [Photorhabdus bodei]
MNAYVNKEIPDVLQSQCGINCLTDICHYSFNEFRQQVSDHLSWSETNRLYRDAQQEQKENQLYEARILKRANPQLQNAVHLGITLPHAELRGYNNEFGSRASQYVAPGSVSSMFSPAAYLTELYREARNLHASDSVYHLDERRPDLQSMELNQKNMDTELSTLSLSNEILLKGIKANKSNLDSDTKVMEMLSTFRPSGTIPYHDAYENVRKAIQLQDPQLEQFQKSHAVAELMHQASLLGIDNSISPELFNLLTEEITEANAEEIYKKNFGDIDSTWLAMPEYLKSYYNLSDEELSQFIHKYPDNELNTQKIHLLKINKIILLSRAVNLPFLKIDEIVPEQSINPTVLGKIFLVKYYMKKYNIDTETALILCNAPISQHSYRNQPSQFDRLFNTPPLNGQYFAVGNTDIDLNLNSTNNWHKTVLKRAFNVDDISLYRLLHIANHENKDGKIANNINNLSNLYMTKLLADIHQLTIDELYLLLMTIGEDKRDLYTIDDENLQELINKLDTLSDWLHTQKWSVYQLFLMTTTNYDKTLTPEIRNLLNTVYNGLQNFDKEKTDLLAAIAPYIAATLQLPSENVAHSILLWADKIKPSENKITAKKFWNWLQNKDISELSKPPEMQEQIIQYCHCLAQLTMIYRSSGINENAFRLFIEQPTIFGISDEPDKATPAHNAPTLIILTRFANWVNTLGEKASPILTAFENKTLTAEQLANAMNLDANLLEQASIQAQNYKQVTKENTFSNWQSIDIILQWTNVANDFNISPQGISSLIALDYIQPSQKTPTYSQWENAVMVLTAGLDTQQMNTLHAFLDESRSTALSNYYIGKIANRAAAIKSRDDLYQYLLIDNQVSAAIKTTRIAEAIASIQLYVNRALENIETHAISDVITRQFFIDWDKYNKRYSTWAGVSQLAYYPENYIDPTMRIGQTKMMDTLLQSVSQSQLNANTVEDAFKSYLTSFEQVANLEVISAYHDNVNNNQGLTYFIGHSKTEVNQYYWRSVDHSKFNDGKFAANAWSEWHKIDCAINPYQSTIRPVIYKSRLYLIWLEQKEIAKQDKDNKVITDYYYELKLAHIRYDGTWNTPIAFDVNSKISALELAKSQAPGLYCAGYQGEDTLLVMFYRKKEKLDDYKTAPMQGFYIFSDMSSKEMTNEQCNSYRDNGYTHFDTNSDTNSVIRINNRYAEDYEIPSLINHSNSHDWGEYNLSQVYGGNIVINYEVASSDLKIKISPKLRIIHEGKEGRERIQCELMKKYGKLGDKFIIYTSLGINPNNSSNKFMFYPVYQYSRNASDLNQGRLLFHRDTNYSSKVGAWIPGAGRSLNKDDETIGDDYVEDSLNKPDDLKQYIYMTDHKGTATDVSGPVDINTAISSEKVQITINAGKEYSLTANKDVSVQPSPSFEEMCYQFNALEIDGSNLNFTNNSASIDVTFTALADDGRKLGYEIFNIPVIQKVKTDNALTLFHDKNGAQYMQWGAYRVRLNTLFARQLVERATTGIDTILSMETQNIQEPQLGKGFYVKFTLPKYDQNTHGNKRQFKIYIGNIDGNTAMRPYYQGILADTETNVILFVPYEQQFYTNEGVKLGVEYNKVFYQGTWEPAFFYFNEIQKKFILINDANYDSATTQYGETKGIIKYKGFFDVSILSHYTDPMDFCGANSLYFWELFYYTPMLVAQRLLHEQNFDEANRWLKYVWSPSGYIVRGQIKNYHWNVRPLLENTSWNSDPLDSVDPDAVAQHDPMHYKVATFMRTLDLLMARGDHAYRQLERDTLNEAKMWYMQALHLLGDKPYLPLSSAWNNPRLDNAADTTTQKAYSYAITTLRQGTQTPALLLRSANTLTDLFLPQINDVMLSYWNKLELRLYNLRHNLSIDGQPLYLPMYATPADPKALLSAAVATSQGGGSLPQPFMSLWRFPHMLENARSMVAQLTQFGSTLQNIIERQDAEALNALLQNQAKELILTTLSIQDKTIEEIDTEKTVLEKSKAGAQSRFDNYSKLYDEDVNAGERQALDMRIASQSITSGLKGLHMAAAALEMVPNIYGFAVGGTRFGAIANAIAIGGGIAADGLLIEAEKVSQSEIWRRRRQEWEIQRNNAEAEMKQIDAQLKSLTVRREAAVLQKTSLKTQQEQTQAQLAFLQRKFSNQALYNWLRGRLAAIYFQFYDLVVARCLMAEQAYRWETNDSSARFIKPGAWQGTYAGLLAGETLMLNLAQMEDAHLKQEQRALEVERTVSLAQVYQSLGEKSFALKDKIEALLQGGKETAAGNDGNQLKLTSNTLSATLTLQDLKLKDDYPDDMQLGKTRRIKQISVSLPALLGPYQDVQAVLSYGGDATGLAKGCKALALSHGLNDNGQFQLDFNDGKFLPFEGIDINDKGTLTLSFPNATSKQKTILQMLTDIILHIRYTILE